MDAIKRTGSRARVILRCLSLPFSGWLPRRRAPEAAASAEPRQQLAPKKRHADGSQIEAHAVIDN